MQYKHIFEVEKIVSAINIDKIYFPCQKSVCPQYEILMRIKYQNVNNFI